MSTRAAKRASKKESLEEPLANQEGVSNEVNEVSSLSQESIKTNGSVTEHDENDLKGFSKSEINGTKAFEKNIEQNEIDQEAENTLTPENTAKSTALEKTDITTAEEEPQSQKEETKEVNGVANENNDPPAAEAEIEHDEPEPELQFDENSDKDSVKNVSPVISRCTTRRSQARSVPTPKSPSRAREPEPEPLPELEEEKAEEEKMPSLELKDDEGDNKQEQETALNEESTDSIDSDIDNLSTKASVGSDATRIDFSNSEFSSFVKSLKGRTFGETLRGLSTRPSIRSMQRDPSGASIVKQDWLATYPMRASVESISGGTKRRRRSISPEDGRKKMRHEPGGGILSYITSPVLGMRNRIGGGSSSVLPSSTPRLTGFRNKNSLLDSEEISKIKLDVNDPNSEEKKWCSIM